MFVRFYWVVCAVAIASEAHVSNKMKCNYKSVLLVVGCILCGATVIYGVYIYCDYKNEQNTIKKILNVADGQIGECGVVLLYKSLWGITSHTKISDYFQRICYVKTRGISDIKDKVIYKLIGKLGWVDIIDASGCNSLDNELYGKLPVMNNVIELNANFSSIDDKSLCMVAKIFPKLETIKLCSTSITAIGVKELSKMVQLKKIDLSGNFGAANIDCLKSLNKLENLRELNIQHTLKSSDRRRINELKKILPKCQIQIEEAWPL